MIQHPEQTTLIHLQSNNPNNYNTAEFNASIIEDVNVFYRVISINTTAAFSLTTQDDFICIQQDDEPIIITFPEIGNYDVKTLNEIFKNKSNLSISQNDRSLIEITSSNKFKILEASHRVKLLLGLYHTKFPLESIQIETTHIIISNSIPYFEQGPIFYLLSRTGSICETNARGKEETYSIVYKTMELIVNSYPITSYNKGNWFNIKSSQLQQLRFSLVDFMLEPIILHSPLYITLEIVKDNTSINDLILYQTLNSKNNIVEI